MTISNNLIGNFKNNVFSINGVWNIQEPTIIYLGQRLKCIHILLQRYDIMIITDLDKTEEI